jgi:hypothetical protein
MKTPVHVPQEGLWAEGYCGVQNSEKYLNLNQRLLLLLQDLAHIRVHCICYQQQREASFSTRQSDRELTAARHNKFHFNHGFIRVMQCFR